MIPESPLDDPRNAAHAWARYARLMRRTGLATVVAVLLAMGGIYLWFGWVSIHVYLATALALLLIIPTTVGLMGLMFLSSGTGHDQAIANPLEDEDTFR
jgi:hypothetical protein